MNSFINPLLFKCGISLKPEHYQQLVNDQPSIGFLEIHPENYMGVGGQPRHFLKALSDIYPLSVHGVGMSLGSAKGVSKAHLASLVTFTNEYQPSLVSEHLAWSQHGGIYLNDLLPVPYTNEALTTLANNIDCVQSALKRRILIENPSTYMEFSENHFDEPSFLKMLVDKTECRLLLDINNVYVSCKNQGRSPYEYLEDYPFAAVEEIHLAGHSIYPLTSGKSILIDDHGSRTCEEVWQLLDFALTKMQEPKPLLIEWDTHVPQLAELLAEKEKAESHLHRAFTKHASNEFESTAK